MTENSLHVSQRTKGTPKDEKKVNEWLKERKELFVRKDYSAINEIMMLFIKCPCYNL